MGEERTPLAYRLADKIAERKHHWTKGRREARQSSHSVRASSLGHPCIRKLVLDRTKGDTAKSFDDYTLGIFREGNRHENDVKMVLTELDFDVFGSQSSFPPNDYNLTGHVDILYSEMEDGEEVTCGVEVKSVNPYHFNQINCAEDLLTVAHWLRTWFVQPQVYMFLADVKSWLIILKNRNTGEWKLLPIVPDDEILEAELDKAVAIEKHVKAQTLPPTIINVKVCRMCDYYKQSCFPAEEHPIAEVISDEHVAGLAALVVEHKQAKKLHDKSWKEFREFLVEWVGDGELPSGLIVGDSLLKVTRRKDGVLLPKLVPLALETENDDDA